MKFWMLTQTWNHKMFSNSRVAIMDTGQRNHPPICAVCVLFMARERAQCIYAPDVLWACPCCLV